MQISLIVRTFVHLFLLLGNLLFMDHSDLKKNSILVQLSGLCRNSVQLFSFLSHIQKKPMSRSSLIELR